MIKFFSNSKQLASLIKSHLKRVAVLGGVLIGSINTSLAIETKNVNLYSDEMTVLRSCYLEFSNSDGSTDLLSAVRIDSTHILSVGHTPLFKKNLSARCGNGQSVRIVQRTRHPLYDYKDNPKRIEEWARYDISIFKTKASANIDPIEILTDKNEITDLFRTGQCIVGGAGSQNNLSQAFHYTTPAPQTGPESITHLTFIYSGDPIVVHGDSGGPLLCRKNQTWALAGLLDYGGVMISKETGEKKNLVAVLILRPELDNDFIKPNLN